MIVSASRRTDIPNYYSEWFFNRIKEGYLYVRNPMNARQVSRIDLSPQVVDCIVFWTKNPFPMMSRLDEIKDYQYYFQFTLTGYGRDMEPNVPHKRQQMLSIFQALSDKIGKERVIWRYDPIVFTDRYTEAYHVKAFQEIASTLSGYTEKVVISFFDRYSKTEKNMEGIPVLDVKGSELHEFANKLAGIAKENHLQIATCAEALDLASCGIEHNCCIDRELIERLCGSRILGRKDKNQRAECGCLESVEIGAYDTCQNSCKYCYANYSADRVERNLKRYRPDSPVLCGEIAGEDKITERRVKSLKDQREIKSSER